MQCNLSIISLCLCLYHDACILSSLPILLLLTLVSLIFLYTVLYVCVY